MKVGSLVECVDTNWPTEILKVDTVFGFKLPVKGVICTIRDIRDQINILLEEIDNSHLAHLCELKIESGFHIKRFRELLPPMENVEEFVNENTLEPELV